MATAKDPTPANEVINVIFSGLGGQGVLKASDILSEAAFLAGFDVKKSEIHGMSQRGGSVTSDVRFGPKVLSPMIPTGTADFVVVLAEEEIKNARGLLRQGGTLITPAHVDQDGLANKRSINVALLGVLSAHVAVPELSFLEAIRANLPPKLHECNAEAFAMGRHKGQVSKEE